MGVPDRVRRAGRAGSGPEPCELGTRARGVRHGRPFPTVGVHAAEPVDIPALLSHAAPWCAHFVTLWKDPASLRHRGPFHAYAANKVGSDWSFFVRSFQGGNFLKNIHSLKFFWFFGWERETPLRLVLFVLIKVLLNVSTAL